MTWRSFSEYVAMREAGKTDATYRGYDLHAKDYLRNLPHALKRADIVYADLESGVQEVMTRFISGWPLPDVTAQQMREYLCEWYIWDRIRKGIVQRWPVRGYTT